MAVVSLNYILFVVIATAAFAGALLFVTSRWFDIRGYRYQLDAQRYAIDLLNSIVSNSPLVERIEGEEPSRLVLSATKLDAFQWEPWEWSDLRESWEKNFILLEFDYELTVEDLVTHRKWKLSNLYFNDSECYDETMRVRGFADIPVVISYEKENGKEKHPGNASLTLRRTPLSQLSFFLSEAFMRSKLRNEDYLRGVRIDGTQVKNITVEGDKVCLNYRNSKKVCKYFYRDAKPLQKDTRLDDLKEECVDVLVIYSAEHGKVILA